MTSAVAFRLGEQVDVNRRLIKSLYDQLREGQWEGVGNKVDLGGKARDMLFRRYNCMVHYA